MTGIATTLTWPVGVTWTAWHYLWRILPVWRSEVPGTRLEDGPPPVPAGVETDGLQQPEDGSGPLFHRLYTGAVAAPGTPAAKLMARLSGDPNVVAPSRLARFKKTRGVDGAMRVGDEFVVRMPGPWDGPIRVLETTSSSFRFGTLDGHLEEVRSSGVRGRSRTNCTSPWSPGHARATRRPRSFTTACGWPRKFSSTCGRR